MPQLRSKLKLARETTRAEDKTCPTKWIIRMRVNLKMTGRKEEVDEEKQAEDMKVEEEKLENLDDAKVELAPPVVSQKHMAVPHQSATTPFATSRRSCPRHRVATL